MIINDFGHKVLNIRMEREYGVVSYSVAALERYDYILQNQFDTEEAAQEALSELSERGLNVEMVQRGENNQAVIVEW